MPHSAARKIKKSALRPHRCVEKKKKVGVRLYRAIDIRRQALLIWGINRHITFNASKKKTSRINVYV